MNLFAKVAIHDGVSITIPLTDDNVFTVCPHSGETMHFPLVSYLKQQEAQTTSHQEAPDDEDEALDIEDLLDALCDGAELLFDIILALEDNDGHQQV